MACAARRAAAPSPPLCAAAARERHPDARRGPRSAQLRCLPDARVASVALCQAASSCVRDRLRTPDGASGKAARADT
ncbi:hypothetical protein BDA96_02G076700 [Sorghum bicolor]|uniref:Uncharacterized protein n=2 Tax=Sorghum bicolor TaxID=4558 RepID=A0A921RM18_SORBI|nr:hypothetical protein BDA96_02G076700 [Sorghum bicolor]KXG34680.1 hypothetical protein SORBI_3002G074800 [Sorghum bicolor]